jgi:hypothetical protein
MQQITLTRKVSNKKMLEALLDVLIASQDDALKSLDQAHRSITETLNYFNQKRRAREHNSQNS